MEKYRYIHYNYNMYNIEKVTIDSSNQGHIIDLYCRQLCISEAYVLTLFPLI